MRPAILALLLAAVIAALLPAGTPLLAREGDDRTSPREPLEWDHPGLDLVLWELESSGDLVRLRFALQLKGREERARTWIGFPRYRTEFSTTWQDTVFQGPHGRSRNLEVSDREGGRAFFAVMVPHDAKLLSLPLGDQDLLLDLTPWIERADRTGEPLRRNVVDDAFEELDKEVAGPPPGRPARLESELRWLGDKPFGDGALDAGEAGELLIDVINDGERTARGVTVRISPATIPHVEFQSSIELPPIDAPGVETVRVPFFAGAEVGSARIPLTIEVVEPYGHDAPTIEFELTTRGVDPQLVLVDDFAVEGAALPVPRDAIVTVRLRVRNVGDGTARGVTARVGTGAGVFRAHDGDAEFGLGDLGPGEMGEFAFRCYANRRAEQMLLEVELLDARSGDSLNRSQVILPLKDSNATARIVTVSPDPRVKRALPPAPAPLTSDIDRVVPQSSSSRPEALAVVFGVESYSGAPRAMFAAEDATTAARYFERVLGVPSRRIQLLLNDEVTLGQLHRIFGRDGWLARRATAESEIFVFFAGHGMAETESFVPYLIPADGDLNYVRQTGFPLDKLVETLAGLDAAQVTVMIDACFSGLTREGGALIADARPLAIVPARREISGISMFSAAEGTQLASALHEQGHGLFSYYLFKGLGGAADSNADGAVTAGELRSYLEQTVPRGAAEIDREQTPSIFIEDASRVLVRF